MSVFSWQFLDKVFPPFSDKVRREKPREMLFIVDEKPNRSTVITAGIQHALVILMVIVYVVIAGRELALSDAELRSFVSLEIIVLGAVTMLQGFQTRFSSGHLVIHTPSIVSAGTFVAVAASFGLGAATGGLILSGIIVILLARFLPRLQSVFPPEITGVLLVLLGFSLVEGGVQRFTGLVKSEISIPSLLVASTVLGSIVIFSVWGNKRMRVFAMAIGIVAGLLVATLFGLFGREQVQTVLEQPLFSFPFGAYQIPTPTFVIAAAIPILIIEVIRAIDSIGTGVAIDQMNNSKWRRPDMPMISRLVTCHGIGVLLNGLTGTLSSGTSSVSLGLAHATGVTARKVAIVAGIVLIISALLPQVAAFIILIPQPVMGAIIVYTAAYMFVVGSQLVLSRMINTRRMFMIGISITVGAAIILMPDLTANVPSNLKPILGSGLTMGVLTAILLNQIFRIGVNQNAEITLTGTHASSQATKFLEECGADWGSRADVIARAGVAVGEALEALNHAELIDGPARLKANFDEYKLSLSLIYPGKSISFEPSKKLDLDALMNEEGDDALDAAMSNMSGVLIKTLADRVSSTEKHGHAELKLTFVH